MENYLRSNKPPNLSLETPAASQWWTRFYVTSLAQFHVPLYY